MIQHLQDVGGVHGKFHNGGSAFASDVEFDMLVFIEVADIIPQVFEQFRDGFTGNREDKIFSCRGEFLKFQFCHIAVFGVVVDGPAYVFRPVHQFLNGFR